MMLETQKRKQIPQTPYKPPTELNFNHKIIKTNLRYGNDSSTPSNGAHIRKKREISNILLSEDYLNNFNTPRLNLESDGLSIDNPHSVEMSSASSYGIENVLPSPLMSVTPRQLKTTRKTAVSLFRNVSGAAFENTPEASPHGTPTKRNIFFGGGREDFPLSSSNTTNTLQQIQNRCPPTPARTPTWLMDCPGNELVRKSSLCTTKVLITLPWDTEAFPSEHDFLFSNEFENLGVIGSGSSYEVYHVRDKYDKREYAVKKAKRIFRSKNDRQRYLEEVCAYQKLGPSCKHIIQYYRAWQEEGFFYLQTEYCDRGNLMEFVKTTSRVIPIPEETLWSWLLEISIALEYLHEHGLVHLDVKTENVFLNKDGELKLGDLGMVKAALCEEDGWEGDTTYMAKELLNSSKKDFSADIFSLGILFYEVASGQEPPKEGKSWHEFRDDKVPLIEGRSDAVNDMIRSLLSSDPAKRPKASDILNHPNVVKASLKKDSFVVSNPAKSVEVNNDLAQQRGSDDLDLKFFKGRSSSFNFDNVKSPTFLPSSSPFSSLQTPKAYSFSDEMED